MSLLFHSASNHYTKYQLDMSKERSNSNGWIDRSEVRDALPCRTDPQSEYNLVSYSSWFNQGHSKVHIERCYKWTEVREREGTEDKSTEKHLTLLSDHLL